MRDTGGASASLDTQSEIGAGMESTSSWNYDAILHPQPCGSSRARSDASVNGVWTRLGGRTHGWDPLHTDV